MKKMYIDYGNYRKRRNTKIKFQTILFVVLLAVIMGASGYVIAEYVRAKDAYEAQKGEQFTPDTEGDLSAADEAVKSQEGRLSGSEDELGLWHKEEENESNVKRDILGEEIWMGDFEDKRVKTKAKGVFVTAATLSKSLSTFTALADNSELNTLVIDVKNEKGNISFAINCDTAKAVRAINETIPDMKRTLKELKEHNIYTVARIVSMTDSVLGNAKPGLSLTDESGEPFMDSSKRVWLNPYKQEVWEYLRNIGAECAAAGFDEVNFDYLRFSNDKGMNKVDLSAETKTRAEVITEGFKWLCEELKPLGVFVSCTVYGTVINGGADARTFGNNYFALAQYADYICPMLYPSDYGKGYLNLDVPDRHPYEFVKGMLDASIKVLYMIDDTGNKAIVRPWLQAYTATWVKDHLNYGADEIRSEIDAVYETGHNEWILWNFASKYPDGCFR